MTTAIDISKLAPQGQRVLGAAAPLPVKMMAAGGVIPGVGAGDVVTIVAVLTSSEHAQVADKARETIRKLPPPILTGALAADLDPAVVLMLADAYSQTPDVVERLLRMPRIDGASLELLAERADERIGEIVA